MDPLHWIEKLEKSLYTKIHTRILLDWIIDSSCRLCEGNIEVVVLVDVQYEGLKYFLDNNKGFLKQNKNQWHLDKIHWILKNSQVTQKQSLNVIRFSFTHIIEIHCIGEKADYCLSNWKFARLGGSLDEIVTIIMSYHNMASDVIWFERHVTKNLAASLVQLTARFNVDWFQANYGTFWLEIVKSRRKTAHAVVWTESM